MDYDDNDFQSQNLHIAGEGSNKYPPVLQPYALPKFDFDDSLHGSLRFDSLVETEVFLGIESNEDSQWIEEFSRGSSGIQFSSSAAETCSISRRNNVWSEATSSESVEMLLKSVGQEELIPAQTSIRESDACDELGCIIKQMEPSLNQDSNIPAKVVDVTNLQSTSLSDELAENFPALDDDGGGQQPQVEDGLQTYKGGSSVGHGLGDLTAISVDVRLPIAEGSQSVDDKCNDVNQREVDTVVNESLDNRTQEGATSEVQVDSAVAGVQNIITGNDRFNNKDASSNVNVSIHDNIDASEIDKGEHQEKGDVLSREVQTHAQVLNAEVVETRASNLDNTLLMALGKSVESSTIETNLGSVEEPCMVPKGNSGLEMSDQSGVDAHKASLVVVEGNTTVEKRKVESSSRSQLDSENLVTESGASLLSTEDNVASGDKVDGSCSTYGAVNSSLPKVCSSAEFVSETHAKGHVPLLPVVESIEICETSVVSRQGDVEKCDKDVPVVEQKESVELSSDGSNMDKIIDKGVRTSSFTEGSTGNELMVLKPQADCTAGSESVDGVPVSSGNGIAEDAIIAHKDVEVPPSPTVFSCSDKEKEKAAKIPTEASFSEHKASCEAKTGVDPVSEPEEASSGTAVQMLCKSVDHSVLTADACNIESRAGPEEVAVEKVSQVCSKDKEVCPALCDSTANKGDCTEALIEENGEKEPKKVSEVNNAVSAAAPSAVEVSCQDSHQKVQKENTVVVSGDTNFLQIAVPNTNVEHENKDDLDKRGNFPAVIKTTELSHDASKKDGFKSSSDQNVSVSKGTDGDAVKGQSTSNDPNQIEAPKDDSSFTFEVSPLADLPRKDAKKWQPFSTIGASKVSPIVDGSTSSSRLGQLDPKISQDLSHGSPKVSEVAVARSGSKGNSERKPRRSSGKSTAKEKAKKGNPIKETASVRLERGDKTTNVSLSPSGVSQIVQSNEMQRYGHVDSNSVKPFVLGTSTSGLPDLNSSVSPAAVFQQPFTDLQQVQLRAQIFVYGALIQGTAPDEAYMISAFGGPDGGRSIWENAWRSCIERLHGQKSPLITAETPLQSRPGARATEQSIKQGALQSKVASSPASRGSSKGTPTIVNSIVPFSSPLWGMSTPGDTLQSSGMPRGPVMDYQRALSPLHPHQTPAVRNFVGHSPSWLSQSPFGGPWVASQNSALDTSGRFSVQLPITETVQLTPVKESSVLHSSVAKPSGPVGQSGASASVLPGTSSVLDVKMVTASAGQTSADPKPRKRKKTLVSENPGQNILPPQPQKESVIASAIPMSTSIAIATPVGFVSKAPTEKFITSVTTTSSMDLEGDQNAEPKAVLSEDSLGKVKEARVRAEDAAALAASAVSHSQEIWDQLDKQRTSGLQPDVETKLASAAVAIAAAAAVAKAAAAAAKVASDAALQAKLMAEELFSSGYSNSCQINATSLSDGMKNLGKATPASILKVDDGTNSSSSILVAAREAARRRVEAASAASKRAENMDAIVKAAELAAEAVSQAGKIVAMGDPFPLSELVAAGPGGYWKVSQVTSELVSRSNQIGREHVNFDSGGEGPDTLARQLKEVLSDKKENQISNAAKSPISTDITIEDHGRLVDGLLGTGATTIKDAKGQKGRKASDLAKTIGVVPESENGSRSSTVQNEFGKAETLKENSIKEGSLVEVFKDGSGFKASWFSATVLSLKEGKAYVRYTELALGEGSGKLEEWVPLEGEGDKAPKIRVSRPCPVMPFEGTKKRRRAALGDYNWSVGDRVDAWVHDSWWEGVVTEKSKKDEAITVNFPAQGETSVFKAWNLRPSLIWRDGEWIEWSSSGENNQSSHGGDTPQEKRQRVRSPAVEPKGKDKASKSIDVMESDKSDDPTLLDLSTDEKLFNIGKSNKDENRPNALRMTRTGLQKEGSRVIFGIPKPGKKRKFMEVSKHYVADGSSQINETNDSVKFTKYLIPQGAGSRGWKSTAKSESNDKRAAVSKPKVLKSGKPQNISGRTIPQKDNLSSPAVSAPDDGTITDHITRTKDSVNRIENTSDKQNLMGFQTFPSSDGATEGPILFSALALPSDTVSSKKMPTSNAKSERVSKGKLAPAGGKLSKIEEGKPLNGSSAKSTSDPVEPRRSNRRIQPTSRLLEGLQSSLMVSKIPSVSHDKSHKSRNASKGNNHG